MQTNLAEWIKDTPEGIEADAILRKCVHCGFCLATCPTYQLTGDELDSPRGRIYLMKEMLEGNAVTAKTQFHLDRCLTCRACETTCPSGVQYGRLADIGREVVEKKVPRSFTDRLTRTVLKNTLPRTALFTAGLGVGRAVKGLLPDGIKKYLTSKRDQGVWPAPVHARKMLALTGNANEFFRCGDPPVTTKKPPPQEGRRLCFGGNKTVSRFDQGVGTSEIVLRIREAI